MQKAKPAHRPGDRRRGGGGIFSMSGDVQPLRRPDDAVKAAGPRWKNQLQRRFDLVPNLVETVKGYANWRTDVSVEVANARAGWGAPPPCRDKISANNELFGALPAARGGERYPELKSNQNFSSSRTSCAERKTASQWSGSATTRQSSLQRAIRLCSGELFAGVFGFEKAAFSRPRTAGRPGGEIREQAGTASSARREGCGGAQKVRRRGWAPRPRAAHPAAVLAGTRSGSSRHAEVDGALVDLQGAAARAKRLAGCCGRITRWRRQTDSCSGRRPWPDTGPHRHGGTGCPGLSRRRGTGRSRCSA